MSIDTIASESKVHYIAFLIYINELIEYAKRKVPQVRLLLPDPGSNHRYRAPRDGFLKYENRNLRVYFHSYSKGDITTHTLHDNDIIGIVVPGRFDYELRRVVLH